jgi:hypothetical protein
MRYTRLLAVAALLLLSLLPFAAYAQRNQNLIREEREKLITRRNTIEQELESVAVIDRKMMVPMRDGKRMQADIYRPNDTSKKYPIIFSRTPYNFNYCDVRLGAPRDMSTELEAVKRGYIYVEMNERGHFFSEGNYEILGGPPADSDDELNWMSAQPWSNGKVGLMGCSSTAEWQLAVAAGGNKAVAAFIPESFAAGVGRWGSGTSRATGSAAEPFRCCLPLGFTASRTRSGRRSRVELHLVVDNPADQLEAWLPPLDGVWLAPSEVTVHMMLRSIRTLH